MMQPNIHLEASDDRDAHAAMQEHRIARAMRRIQVGDVLAICDDMIAEEPDETKHPLYDLARFLLDQTTAVDGAKLYNSCRALVREAVEAALEDELAVD